MIALLTMRRRPPGPEPVNATTPEEDSVIDMVDRLVDWAFPPLIYDLKRKPIDEVIPDLRKEAAA